MTSIPVHENPDAVESPREAVDVTNPQDIDFAHVFGQPSANPAAPAPIEEQLPDATRAQPSAQVHATRPQGRQSSIRDFVEQYRG